MSKDNTENWLILLILSIIWGSSFILMKKSLVHFNHLEVAFFRLIIAFLVLSPFIAPHLKKIRVKYIFPLLIISIVGTVIPAILFALAQIHLDSANVGMLNALTPIFTLVIGIILFNKKVTNSNIVGVIVGLIGSYILIFPNNISETSTKYSLIVIIATICYAISINTIKKIVNELGPFSIAIISSLISCIIPLFYIINNGISNTIFKIHTHISSFYYIVILGTICTSLAIVIFNQLIKRSSALFGSSTTYLIPVFAIIWGIIDNETIAKNEIYGIIVIFIGVFIMNYQRLEY